MSTPLEVVQRALASHGCKGKGTSWQCPGHEDERPSLSVTEGDDGRVLLKCWAGCAAENIVAVLGLKMSDLFPPREEKHIGDVYPYRDEVGAVVFEKVRYEPKGFSQRRPDGRGGYTWNLNGVRLVPFRLPELRAATEAGETVYLTEGEKGALSLVGLGITATTTGGAKSWRKEHAQFFNNVRVVITPDNDQAGREYARVAGLDLVTIAAEVRVLELPGLPGGGDPFDFVAAGGAVEQLDDLTAEAPTFTEWAKTKAEKSESRDAKTPPPEEKRVIRRPLVDVICGIKRRNPFPLGLPHLDAMLGGGLSAGDSLVLGGGPGTIKTTTLATMIRALAGPRTAIFGVFFDEHYERVCRKVAARFGLRYDETEEPSEPATTRLGAELARLDAFFEVVTPETDPTVEAITQECRAATPEGRVTAIFVDHIQRLRSGATGDRDNPSTAVGNVVNALMRATARGAIVVAISEVTKAATLSEVLRANPAGVFADSRAILSRFDVGLATVKLQAPPDSREVLAEVLGTGKNRFGSGQGSYVAALDLETWSIATRDAEAVNAESEQRKTAAKRQRKSAEMRADDDNVLSYIVARSASQQDGMKRRDVVKGLPASGSGVSESRTDQALIRLRSADRTEEYQTRAPGVTRGPDATYVRILPGESPA